MANTGDFCPLSRASEIFAMRWTPLIVRNLLLGCRTFSEIEAGLPGISRTLLTQRLRLLEHHGLVERRTQPARRGAEYVLTEAGAALEPVCRALGAWGEQWLVLRPDETSASSVLWALSKYIGPDDLPPRRSVVRFDVEGDRRYWLLLDRPTVELCMKPPGECDDLVVATTGVEPLLQWFTGRLTIGAALHARLIRLEGPGDLARRFGSWGGRGSYGAPLPADAPPRLVAV
jgi:DNA-binding HxlR family transcriptional regulator